MLATLTKPMLLAKNSARSYIVYRGAQRIGAGNFNGIETASESENVWPLQARRALAGILREPVLRLGQPAVSNPPYPFDNPFKGRDEVFPRDRMPIIRRCADGKLRPKLRQWGFIMMINGKTIDPATGTAKKVRKDVFNAMSEKLTSSFTWRFAFKERRCLIPMSSWDEWPETSAGKQRVRASIPGEPVFMAAGLYETSVDPKSGDKVPTYTNVQKR